MYATCILMTFSSQGFGIGVWGKVVTNIIIGMIIIILIMMSSFIFRFILPSDSAYMQQMTLESD